MLTNNGAITSHCSSVKSVSYFCLIIHLLYHFFALNTRSYSYIFEAGKVGGKRKVVEKVGFPTKLAAYKAGVEAYTDWLHDNIEITSESITLADFMTQWFDNVLAGNIKASTMQTYKSLFGKQIVPYMGEIKLQELTPAKLDDWLRKLQRKGLAKGTLADIHGLTHNALNYAVYPAQLIQANPIAAVKIPKGAPRRSCCCIIRACG